MNSPDSTSISETEWQARRTVAAALDPLDDAGRGRVLAALAERFGLDLAELRGVQDDDQDAAAG